MRKGALNSQNPSDGTHNGSRYTLPKRPVFKQGYAFKVSWSDWQKNYNSDLVMSRKSTWETHFHNEREKKTIFKRNRRNAVTTQHREGQDEERGG